MAMWMRRWVIVSIIAAIIYGCNPFEGTIFEFRAPKKSAKQTDPNSVWLMEPSGAPEELTVLDLPVKTASTQSQPRHRPI